MSDLTHPGFKFHTSRSRGERVTELTSVTYEVYECKDKSMMNTSFEARKINVNAEFHNGQN